MAKKSYYNRVLAAYKGQGYSNKAAIRKADKRLEETSKTLAKRTLRKLGR